MAEIEKIGVRHLAFELVEALDEAFGPLAEEAAQVTVVGGVTATGSQMTKALLRKGFAVLVDDRVEVWHRDAVLGTAERVQLGEVNLDAVIDARIRRRSIGLEVKLLDVDDKELLRLSCAGEGEVIDAAELAVRTWLTGAAVDPDLVELPTLGERRDATLQRVRDQTRGVIGTFTLEEYRAVMDQAMEQVVEVLAVQSAEIRDLQRRVLELERRRDGDGVEDDAG